METTLVHGFFGDYPDHGFVGFWGVFKTDYMIASEVVATKLKEPLVAGQAYYFSVDVRSRGHANPYHDYSFSCLNNNPLSLQIYLNDSEIQSGLDDKHAVTNVYAQQIQSISHQAIYDTVRTYEWTTITACFTAQGGETDIAFSLNIEPFSAHFPCDESNRHGEWFSMHYINLDNFMLTPIPQQIQDTVLLCENDDAVLFDIKDHFQTIELEHLHPIWSDGITDLERHFEYEGEHVLDLELDCGRIETTVLVEMMNCKNPVFVPTAFTPNFDGKKR